MATMAGMCLAIHTVLKVWWMIRCLRPAQREYTAPKRPDSGRLTNMKSVCPILLLGLL